MILTFALIGIALSGILIVHNAKRFITSVYLGGFFLGISFYALNHYVLFYSQSVAAVNLILLIIPVSGSLIYLIGPMLYWYVRSVLTDNYHLRRTDTLHLLPFVIFFIASIPAFFEPWPDRMNAASAIVSEVKAIGSFKPTLLSHVFSYPILFLSRPVLVLCYLCWSAGLLIRYLLRSHETKLFASQRFMIKWLFVLLLSLLLLVVSHILLTIEFTLSGSNVFFTLTTLKMLSLTGLSFLLLSPFFFPEVLYGLPQIPEIPKTTDISLSKNTVQQSDSEQAITRFEAGYLIEIEEKANSCMQDFKPYLQPDFNLAQLSVLMHLPVHHLAYYLREVKKQSFSDFRNEWRVEHAKKLITEGKSTNLTLEAIGFLSGFASRNTFLHAFKKIEGISPQVFLSRIRKEVVS